MKNIVFVVSHIGSGSELLVKCLDQNPRIQAFELPHYHSLEDLNLLTSQPHKLRNTAAIYVDHLLFNHQFSFPPLFKICQFIYLVREARPTLNKVGKDLKRGDLHYRYRLRRICEMARQTPGAVLVTWDDLVSQRGLRLIESYLDLKVPLKIEAESEWGDRVDIDLINRTQARYERYLFKLRSYNLKTC